MCAAIRPLTLKNQVVKSLRRVDQIIKHTFCRSNRMIVVANASTGDKQVTTPWGATSEMSLQVFTSNVFSPSAHFQKSFLRKKNAVQHLHKKETDDSHHVASFIPSPQPQLSLNS